MHLENASNSASAFSEEGCQEEAWATGLPHSRDKFAPIDVLHSKSTIVIGKRTISSTTDVSIFRLFLLVAMDNGFLTD